MTRTLWIDSTLARSAKKMRLLSEHAGRRGWPLRIHPQVHLEQARQLAVFCAASNVPFDPRRFRSILRQLSIPAEPFTFDFDTAERWGVRLQTRFPSDEEWQAAKRRALGIEGAKRVPMTTDWWMALAAEDDATSIVVTDDGGEEWRELLGADRAWTWKRACTELAIPS